MPINLEKLVFRSFRGLQGTLVPAIKTDEFVLMRNISFLTCTLWHEGLK